MTATLPDTATPREKMRLHATRRLWQRHGIAFSISEYEAICVGIRAGLYSVHTIGEKSRPIYQLNLRGRTLFAVWEPPLEGICTFLPHKTWIARDHKGRMRPSARQAAEAVFAGAQA